MELNELVRLKEQIKPKIEKGDFVVVGKMLGISQENARMRFGRNKEQEIFAMKAVVENREKLIEGYQKHLVKDFGLERKVEYSKVIGI